MPSVPQYSAPQVAARPLPDAAASSPASASFFSGDARTADLAGAALKSVGDAVYAASERENADRVFRAEAQAKDDYIKVEQDWRQNRQGRGAKGLTDDAGQWWNEYVKKQQEGLDNDVQRRILQRRLGGMRAQSLTSVSHFEAQQLEKSHDDSWAADKTLTINAAAANANNIGLQSPGSNGTPATVDPVDSARMELQRLNRYQAARKGWEPQILTAEDLKDTTELHKQVLQGLVKANPLAAQAYFEKYKGEIAGTQQAEIGQFAQKATSNAIGERVVDEVWAKHGPASDTAPTNLDVMEKAIREALKDNEYAKTAAVTLLKERSAAFDKGTREREAANASAVSQAFMGGKSIGTIRAMPEFLSLPGTRQAQFVEHFEGQNEVKRARSDAERTRTYFAAYEKYNDPTVLRDLSRNQVLGLLPDLGQQLTEHLLTRWDSLEKGSAHMQARMDNEDFNHVAQEAGLRPFDPHKSESERAALGELKYRIEQSVASEQQKAKRELTRDEKMQLFRREMDNTAIQRNSFWFDAKRPTILMTPDQLKNAYVDVDGKRVQLSTIPLDKRAEIITERQKRGLPVTETDIARTWVNRKPQRQRLPTDPKYVPE